MTRLLYMTKRSPYARKIRIAMLEKNLSFELREVDLSKRSAEFMTVSPLAKVPVLVDDDGTRIFDSTVIAEYLEDRYPETRLYGASWRERLINREGEELGDTIADQSVGVFWSKKEGNESAAAEAQE